MNSERKPSSFARLVDVIARLRGPDGCPWDKRQTHLSLKPHLVEECYEVLEAIDEADPPHLCEELGDLLMQIVLHAQIASEQGDFDIEDVSEKISDKLIHRHPHVFAEGKVESAQEVVRNWHSLKQEEREDDSAMSGLPTGMPALAYGQAIQRRAAAVGFDWENADGVMEKLAEEMEEIRQASDPQERAREFGDLIFTLVNVARWLEIDLEDALRQTNARFCRRFRYMEETCRQRGVELKNLSPRDQNDLWEEAKARLSPDQAEEPLNP